MGTARPPEGGLSGSDRKPGDRNRYAPQLFILTDRNHLNAPSIGRHHTLPEERALIVTGRDSVPVASSIARSIVVGVSVAAHDDGGASFVEASSVEAATSIMEATTPETSAFSRSRVCAGYSEGG
jgi:hypothetical protein